MDVNPNAAASAAHLTDEQIERYVTKQAAPEAFLSASRHLSDCADCAARVRSARAATRATRTDLATQLVSTLEGHPPSELLERFVGNQTNAREHRTVQNHLTLCARCRAEETQLRAFRTEAEAAPVPAALVALAAATKPVPHRTRTHPLLSFVRNPAFSLATAVAGALLVYFRVQPQLSTVSDLRAENLRLQQSDAQRAALESQLTAKERELNRKNSELATTQAKASQERMAGIRQGKSAERTRTAVERERLRKELARARSQQTIQGSEAVELALSTSPLGRGSSGGVRGAKPEWRNGPPAAAGGAFGPLHPVNLLMVSDRPTFKWNPFPGAVQYLIQIEDEQGKSYAPSAPQTKNSWQPERPLPRGRVLRWRVLALTASGDRLDQGDTLWKFAVMPMTAAQRYVHLQIEQAKAKALIGQTPEARKLLEEIKDLLPGTKEATQAEKMLQGL